MKNKYSWLLGLVLLLGLVFPTYGAPPQKGYTVQVEYSVFLETQDVFAAAVILSGADFGPGNLVDFIIYEIELTEPNAVEPGCWSRVVAILEVTASNPAEVKHKTNFWFRTLYPIPFAWEVTDIQLIDLQDVWH